MTPKQIVVTSAVGNFGPLTTSSVKDRLTEMQRSPTTISCRSRQLSEAYLIQPGFSQLIGELAEILWFFLYPILSYAP